MLGPKRTSPPTKHVLGGIGEPGVVNSGEIEKGGTKKLGHSGGRKNPEKRRRKSKKRRNLGRQSQGGREDDCYREEDLSWLRGSPEGS